MTGVYVDFTLDGVGMQLRHCAIEDRGPRDGCFIQAASRGAVVLVNGEALEEGGAPTPLKHLDRITLGPCRLLSVFLTSPMSSEENNAWTYDAAFQELLHHESLQWTLLSPVRRRLLDKLKEAELLYVEQANAVSPSVSQSLSHSLTHSLTHSVGHDHT